MKFSYQYYFAKFFNFTSIESQEEYNNFLDQVRNPVKTDLVPPEYFNLEVEVELRIITPKSNGLATPEV